MRYKIYQANIEHPQKFRGLRDKKEIDFTGYEQVYEGNIEGEGNSDKAVLEKLFYKFNMEHPLDFEGHSLSVSDIVFLDDKPYFCDSIGWQEVDLKNRG